ncbi:DUF4397 domain-containing protein [Alkalibacillus almallahensis]|uniref:DUF4397 domain-containing protein n=1 Tax=Alkalibacillus almallahensis TaxID=1379154 RepID=UPI0014204953|nr:DUF4397 domain-containing protein [Alkalibacillus almallahensis]NIK12477.1 hypothetical protein [Alkalibacillus almallahensis]
MKKVFILLVTAVMLSSVFAIGALADNHDSSDAMVRIVHASPDAPAVNVYVNGEATVEGAAFKDATDYMNLPAGEHDVAIYPAEANGEGDPVISQTLTIEAGEAYTVAAVGMLDNLSLKVASDSMSVSEGMSKVRVGHLSPDAPMVDVGVIDGDALFSGASFPAITDYQELEAGTYDLEVRTEDGTQVLDLSGTTLEENTVYSVFAVNTADSLEAWVLTDYTMMPSEMPQTGMGGAQSDMNNMFMIGLGTVLAGIVVAGIAINRKNSYQA